MKGGGGSESLLPSRVVSGVGGEWSFQGCEENGVVSTLQNDIGSTARPGLWCCFHLSLYSSQVSAHTSGQMRFRGHAIHEPSSSA
eukprot:763117-Hanusia_phi.AAC.8